MRFHQRGHGNIGIVQQRQRRGIDRRRIDQRLVALDVHDHRCISADAASATRSVPER